MPTYLFYRSAEPTKYTNGISIELIEDENIEQTDNVPKITTYETRESRKLDSSGGTYLPLSH